MTSDWRLATAFKIGDVPIGDGSLFLIAGPCVIESEEHAVKMAECIAGVAKALHVPYIFKASYDKANRTSLESYRGPGVERGLRVLEKVKRAVKVPVLTDVHEAVDVQRVAEVADVLQIPAFLCRQTDLIVAAAKSGCAVNIKKGQFVSPWDMRHAVQKARDSGNKRVFVTERGSSFGYNNLVVDMRSIPRMRDACRAPVIFDATHSVQRPGQGEGGASGGAREFIPVLAAAAIGAGADGLFLETHPDPDHAPSDGPNMVRLDQLNALIARAVDIWDRARRQ